MSNTIAVQIDDLTVAYNYKPVLWDIDLEIPEGVLMAIVGPNGAGKSTMMKIITCYLPQTSGEVKVCGFDVTKDEMEVKKRVGYLPEHNPLYLEMYVKEYLSFVAGLHKIKNKKDQVAQIIELVGLQVEQKKKIGALSKGYRQRVGLAQALIHNPDVLILDEPTTGLDPNQIEEIRNLIKKIGLDKTVLMSTHIMQEVEAVCDRVLIINKGVIVADDTAKHIRSSQSKTIVIKVEFSATMDEGYLRSIQGVTEAKSVSENLWLIEANRDVRDELFKLSVEHNNSVLTLQKEEEKLENIFRNLTK